MDARILLDHDIRYVNARVGPVGRRGQAVPDGVFLEFEFLDRQRPPLADVGRPSGKPEHVRPEFGAEMPAAALVGVHEPRPEHVRRASQANFEVEASYVQERVGADPLERGLQVLEMMQQLSLEQGHPCGPLYCKAAEGAKRLLALNRPRSGRSPTAACP